MNEKLMTEIFTEKHEVSQELKSRIHNELLKQEQKIMARNILISLAAVFLLSFFVISFAVIIVGDIISILLTITFSVFTAFMATALAVVAGKYEIRNIQKGLS